MLGTLLSKWEKSLNMGELIFHVEKTTMLPIAAANESACFSFSAANYSQKLHEKYSIRTVAHGIRQFH